MHTTPRLALLLLATTATPAVAQEGGLMDINTGLMIWTLIIFFLVLGILYKAAFPHILGAVEAREARIRQLIEEAAQDRESARIALEEQTRQLQETRAQVQEMVAEGKAAGERVREELLSEGRRQSEEITARARRDARQELDNAIEELRVEAVDIAIAAASKLIERNLDQDDNRRLVQRFLSEVDRADPRHSVGV